MWNIANNSGLSDFLKISLAVLLVGVGAWHLNQFLMRYGVFNSTHISIPVERTLPIASWQEPTAGAVTNWNSFLYGDTVLGDIDVSKRGRIIKDKPLLRDELLPYVSYLLTVFSVVVLFQLVQLFLMGAIRRSYNLGARVFSSPERLMLKNPLLKATLSPQAVSDKVGTPITMTRDEQEKMLRNIGWYELDERNRQRINRQSIKAS